MSHLAELEGLLRATADVSRDLGLDGYVLHKTPGQMATQSARLMNRAHTSAAEVMKAQAALPKRADVIEKQQEVLARGFGQLQPQQRPVGELKGKGPSDPGALGLLPSSIPSLGKSALPSDEPPPVNLETFLRNAREDAMCELMLETETHTMDSSIHSLMTALSHDWEEDKKVILETKSLRTLTFVPTQQYMHYVQSFAIALNELLERKERAPINQYISTFLQLSQDLNVHTRADLSQIRSAWQLISSLCSSSLPSHRISFHEGRADAAIEQVCSFFETQFRDHIAETIARNPLMSRGAGSRGARGTRNDVVSYLSIQQMRTGFLRKDGWEEVYLCLRCGDVAAAREAARAHNFQTFYRSIDDVIRGTWPDTLQLELEQDYLKETGGRGMSVWQSACYGLLGFIPPKFNVFDVCETSDDFVWYNLFAIRKDPDEEIKAALHRVIVSSDGAHFDALTIFILLLAVGQYGEAVSHLYRHKEYAVEAVHFALVLHEGGLLHVSPSLSLCDILISYSDSFANDNIKFAFNYFRMVNDPQDRGEGLKHLILTYPNHLDELAGTMERREGLLERHLSLEERNAALEEAAYDSRTWKRSPLLTVHLLFLLGKYSDGLSKLNHILGFHVAGHIENESRQEILAFSVNISRYMCSLPAFAEEETHTLSVLLALADFFDHVSVGHFIEALHIIDSTGILPQRAFSASSSVSSALERFKKLSPHIQSNIGPILCEVIHSLVRLALSEGADRRSLCERINDLIAFRNEISNRISTNDIQRMSDLCAAVGIVC